MQDYCWTIAGHVVWSIELSQSPVKNNGGKFQNVNIKKSFDSEKDKADHSISKTRYVYFLIIAAHKLRVAVHSNIFLYAVWNIGISFDSSPLQYCKPCSMFHNIVPLCCIMWCHHHIVLSWILTVGIILYTAVASPTPLLVGTKTWEILIVSHFKIIITLSSHLNQLAHIFFKILIYISVMY